MPNVIYDNFVLENKYSSILTTKLDLQRFMTVDNTLTANAGMIKKVITKTASGDVEDLEMGEGNTEAIEVSTSTKDYVVGTTQGKFVYYDEGPLLVLFHHRSKPYKFLLEFSASGLDTFFHRSGLI